MDEGSSSNSIYDEQGDDLDSIEKEIYKEIFSDTGRINALKETELENSNETYENEITNITPDIESSNHDEYHIQHKHIASTSYAPDTNSTADYIDKLKRPCKIILHKITLHDPHDTLDNLEKNRELNVEQMDVLSNIQFNSTSSILESMASNIQNSSNILNDINIQNSSNILNDVNIQSSTNILNDVNIQNSSNIHKYSK